MAAAALLNDVTLAELRALGTTTSNVTSPPLGLGNVSLSGGNGTRPEEPPSFNDISMIKTVVFGIMFVISLFGNAATLVQMYRMRRRKSTINVFIVNLAIADLLVTFFCIAGEAVWAATVQWYAGNAMCKLIKYLQVFALYLSTYITVAISLDRCVAILDPMRRNGAQLRVRIMIFFAWFFGAFLSIPQAIIFNVRRGPFREPFYQCVTHGSYQWEWQRQLYSIASLLLMFVIPLVIIGTAYGLIFATISRKSKEFTVHQGSLAWRTRNWFPNCQNYRHYICMKHKRRRSRKESAVSASSLDSRGGAMRSNLLRKARRKSLRMSIVIVLAFIVCWTPYYVIFICITFLWDKIEPRTQLIFFFIGMSNSLLNPMIYGAFQLCKVQRPRSWRRGASPDSTVKFRVRASQRAGTSSRPTPNTQPSSSTRPSSKAAEGSRRQLLNPCHCEECRYGCAHPPRSDPSAPEPLPLQERPRQARGSADLKSCCFSHSL